MILLPNHVNLNETNSTFGQLLLCEKMFAKGPKMLRAEQICNEIRDLAVKEKVSSKGKAIYTLKTELEGIFEELFNFFDVTISIPDISIAETAANFRDRDLARNILLLSQQNAVTFPGNATVLDQLNPVVMGAESYRFKYKIPTAYLRITMTMIRAMDNGRQMLGVLLHEIGHNFYYSNLVVNAVRTYRIVGQLKVFFDFCKELASGNLNGALTFREKILSVVGLIQNAVPQSFAKYYLSLYSKLTDNEVVSDFVQFLTESKSMPIFREMEKLLADFADIMSSSGINWVLRMIKFRNSIHNIIEMISLVRNHATRGVSIILNVFFPFLASAEEAMDFGDSYVNEKFADDFATVHGYGADCTQFLLKMEVRGTFADTFGKDSGMEAFDTVVGLATAVGSFHSVSADVHPQVISRINSVKARLIKEKQTAGPKEKKALEEQLRTIETVIESSEAAVKAGQIIDMSWIDSLKDLVGSIFHFGSTDKIAVIDRANNDNGVQGYMARLLNV